MKWLEQGNGLVKRAAPFLARFGVEHLSEAIPLPGTGPNAVFRLRDGARDWVLKCYRPAASKSSDSFRAERAFYTLLWERGIKQIPQPLGWDEQLRMGLFEFVNGRQLAAGEINLQQISEAVGFIAAINRLRLHAAGRGLPRASDACFSLSAHFEWMAGRLRRLQKMEAKSDADRQAAKFVADELEPSWQIVQQILFERCNKAGISPEQKLPLADLCLSPGDLGFHNAILEESGRVRFYDFEDAGWDDPARLICDFFVQPFRPAPMQFWNAFAGGVARTLGLGTTLLERAGLLWPVCRIRWCCVLLEQFVSGVWQQQVGAGDIEAQKQQQLLKARACLKALADEGCNPPRGP